jgi:hypothetical protein
MRTFYHAQPRDTVSLSSSIGHLTRALLPCLVIFAAVGASAADDYKEATDIEHVGNSWREGDPIPSKLLEYRESWDGSCFPNPRGTETLFGSITNYALLWRIVLLPSADLRVFTNAVNHALIVGGPNRFFKDLADALKKQPQLQKTARIKMLEKQSRVRHIVVDSLYISLADMVPTAARTTLDGISRELREGKPWHEVYWNFMEKYETSYEDKTSDGTIIKGNRSKIGNLGDFVLPVNRNPMFSFREDWMPRSHLKKLLAANEGEILVLFDIEDLSRFPDLAASQTGERYVLHRVREVYGGR